MKGQPLSDKPKENQGEKKSIKLELQSNDFLSELYGEHNSHLSMIEQGLDVTLDSFGNIITISGDSDDIEAARATLEALHRRIIGSAGGDISSLIVADALRFSQSSDSAALRSFAAGSGGIKTWRKTVLPRSAGQAYYLAALSDYDVVFGLGPAGTGKTYLAVLKAVEALKSKQVERIVLSRPAVEAGERLGFLPGDMKDKVDPYLRPLYDSLYDMMAPDQLDRMLASGQIEIAPLAFMRGRTLSRSYVIIDEAQNTTPVQMKMVLTRLGDNSKMVITGDLGQVDLASDQRSGLSQAVSILSDVEGIKIVRLQNQDIVRHSLVSRILTAYEGSNGDRANG